MPVRLNRSLCEESGLLGPIERQIEFGQSRRSELDGLPALQDRFNQLRAQEAAPARMQASAASVLRALVGCDGSNAAARSGR